MYTPICMIPIIYVIDWSKNMCHDLMQARGKCTKNEA